jgi:type I restriction enzyme M protein
MGAFRDRYLNAEKRGLIAAAENLRGKYAVSSRELEHERDETLKTLDGFLKGLGYLRVDHGPHPRTNRT